MRRNGSWRLVIGLSFATAVLASIFAAFLVLAPVHHAPAAPQTEESRPGRDVPGGQALNRAGDAEMWRAIRKGVSGTVSIPDKKAAVLVQAEGEEWRRWRNGPIAVVGAVAFWVMFFVVVGFYIMRGPVRTSHGPSGRKVLRFSSIERFGHWLTAGSFIVLAVTGVNMLYGKHFVLPILGNETFSWLTQMGKYVHNYVGFAFISGLLLIFVLWVRDNIWDRYDWNWIKKGGGLLLPNQHPPAAKFNFGQKTVFWMVMGGGGILSVTGLNLLFPFFFTTVEQMQWIQAIHGTLSQVLCMLMVAHIYIGTVGMEGAFRAMSSGYVDESWAKQHHSAWLEEVRAKGRKAGPSAPAHAPATPAE
jgi:formate dehydrogenase subunit gamma